MVDDPWSELGLAPTRDVQRIKKAYAVRLKRVHPEDDAEGFQRLREAYEAALAFARGHELPRFGERTHDWFVPAQRPAPVLWRPGPEASSQADTEALVERFERLHADPEGRALEASWRELLASESLWNVDTRGVFEAALIERLLQPEYVLAPAAWVVLQEHFHWTEQSLSFYRTLPRDAVDRLLERGARASIEFGSRLCDEQRYDEARAVVAPALVGQHYGLARDARRLLARCSGEEAADGVLREVERLRGDESAWTSVAAWRRLLDDPALRKDATQHAFKHKLFEFLVARGSGLSGEVWLLLDTACGWTRELPEAAFAHAALMLGPAIADAADELARQGQGRAAIEQLGRVVASIDGDPGRRARATFERCCRSAVARAETQVQAERFADAVVELAPVARWATPDIRVRASGLLERVGQATIERAERLAAKRRHREAIEHLAPVVAALSGALGTQARLLLARCHVAEGGHAKAEDYLAEALSAAPESVPALLMMAAVQRARNQLGLAEIACRHALALDPENEKAKRELRAIEAEQRQAETEAGSQPGSSGSGIGIGIGLMVLVNGLRSCGSRDSTSVLSDAYITKSLAFLALSAVGVALVLILFSSLRGEASVSGLGLDSAVDEPPPRRRSRRVFAVVAGMLLVGASLVAVLAWQPAESPPPAGREATSSRPASTGSGPRWGVSMAREVSILSLGPTELPLKPGRRVVLSATVRYKLAAGSGVVSLQARSEPGGSTLEVASAQVNELSGTVELQGAYTVPRGARRIDVVVPLRSYGASGTSTVAHAFLAVEER